VLPEKIKRDFANNAQQADEMNVGAFFMSDGGFAFLLLTFQYLVD